MPEAWEISPSDERFENQVSVFIIFCEDQNDEPYYFRSFEVENKVKINCIPNQRKAKLNLINALTYCSQVGLVDYVDHTFKVKENGPENVWCVYDRDLEDTDFEKIKVADDIGFTTAITTALHAGINVAWSNDVFELWVLLHFEQVPGKKKIHRNYVYERLTEVAKKLIPVQQNYAALIAEDTFNYKAQMKRRQAFLTYILPVLKDKTPTAIENAISLEENYEKSVPYHDCNPCTQVHHLVMDIIRAQA